MSLLILHQESLFTETQSHNGTIKNVHYIVKNTPFSVRLGVTSPLYSFTTSSLRCALLYDLDDELKEVDTIKTQPLDYSLHPESNGNTCTIQFKVSVLTSQQQCHFIIRVRLVDNHNGSFLEALTLPIKPCSKLEQIRRKEEELQGKKEQRPKKKRARGEELLEALAQIKQTQQEQAALLSTL